MNYLHYILYSPYYLSLSSEVFHLVFDCVQSPTVSLSHRLKTNDAVLRQWRQVPDNPKTKSANQDKLHDVS